MDLLTLLVTLGVFGETTYLTLKSIKPNKVEKDSVILDTSVLIDGRILPIARSGLLSAPLIVPNSVVRELQFMADKADHDKRERARFGLDMIEQLQSLEGVELRVVEDGKTDSHGVDEQLIKLSKLWGAKLCTIDYNLNKSARVQAVKVININELAHSLRVLYLPGEELEVKLVQVGQDSHQAVGYLDDGTMVVVDKASGFIGQTVLVEATRVLQTAAGKMLFAKHNLTQAVKTSRPVSSPTQRQTRRRAPRSQSRNPEDKLVDLANK